MPFTKQNIMILGVGKTGITAYNWLSQQGHDVGVWDDNKERLHETGLPIKEPSKDVDCIVISPGIKPTHPIVQEYGDIIITDIELFLNLHPDKKYIGVTGTNGKSTLVSQITHCLKKHGLDAVSGGNIGIPIFDLPDASFYVIELSSFQLHYTHKARFDLGILLDITPDHIDWHGSFKAYRTAKEKILSFSEKTLIHPFTEKELFDAISSVASLNIERAHLETYQPLPYRLQVIRQTDKRIIINDSKSTNQDSLVYAVSKYNDITLVCGGQEKDGANYSDVAIDRIKEVYLLGEACTGPMFSFFNSNVPTLCSETLEKTIPMLEQKDPSCILFSPGCASFDQYKNYEERGKDFTERVLNSKL